MRNKREVYLLLCIQHLYVVDQQHHHPWEALDQGIPLHKQLQHCFKEMSRKVCNKSVQKKTQLTKINKNKPSFCTGSCDEIHATSKWQNKTSLKVS